MLSSAISGNAACLIGVLAHQRTTCTIYFRSESRLPMRVVSHCNATASRIKRRRGLPAPSRWQMNWRLSAQCISKPHAFFVTDSWPCPALARRRRAGLRVTGWAPKMLRSWMCIFFVLAVT